MVFEWVRQLHENELWSNLIAVAPLALSLGRAATPPTVGQQQQDGGSGSPTLSYRQKQQLICLIADAFYESKEFCRAEALFKESLQLCHQVKKTSKSTKKVGSAASSADDSVAAAAENVSSSSSSVERGTSEIDIKYKLHLCYLRTNQHNMAADILQSIPAKQRTPKVYQALGKVYQQAGMERPAITCFREVLKSCPLALEAAQTLMTLGVKARDIQSLAIDMTSNPSNGLEWFNQWTTAYAAFCNRDYSSAVHSFKQLEDRNPLLRNNLSLLVAIGQCQHYSGEHAQALSTLMSVHRLDPTNLRGMDVLAALLAKEKRLKELEALATKLMAVTEEAPEPWVATGYHCYASKKGTRAVYFAHKACMLQHKNAEALLLKGNVLLDMKKLQDAMTHFREAVTIAPHRYETHEGLVECYLAQSRHREAVSVATSACKALNNSARGLSLLASVLHKDPLQLSMPKAKACAEKALNADPNHLPAVYVLASILEAESHLEGAVVLLKSQLNSHSNTSKLHLMLADLLGKLHDEERAMDHYSIALNLNPRNVPAQEGLQKLEQATDTVSDRTYDIEMDEGAASDDAADLEESETEAIWSDGDLTLAPTSNRSF